MVSSYVVSASGRAKVPMLGLSSKELANKSFSPGMILILTSIFCTLSPECDGEVSAQVSCTSDKVTILLVLVWGRPFL